jgi:hypothetical protein
MTSKQLANNTYRKLLDDIAGIYDGARRENLITETEAGDD